MANLANNVATDEVLADAPGKIDPIGEGTGEGVAAAQDPSAYEVFKQEIGNGEDGDDSLHTAAIKNDKGVEMPEAKTKGSSASKKTVEPTKENEDEEAHNEEQTEDTTATKPTATTKWPDKRDYSGLDPDEIEALRATRNQGFEKLRPLLLERKELRARADTLTKELETARKGGLPESYAQHDSAYILSPEFAQLTTKLTNTTDLESHYRQQLRACRGGNDWQEAVPDGKGGFSLVTRPASAEADVDLMTAVNQLSMEKARVSEQIQGLANTHKQRHSQLLSYVQKATDTFFPGLTDAELAKPEKAAYASEIKKIREAFPAALHNDPLLPALAKAHVIIQEQQKARANNVAAAGKTVLKQGNKVIAGPTKASVVNGGKSSTKRDIASAWRAELGDED